MSKLQYETESTKDVSQQDHKSHNKRTFFISISLAFLHSLIKLALVAAVIGIATTTNSHQFRNSNAYLRVQQNLELWQQQIITDFRVVQGYNCPEGFQEYSNYSWPGNIEGCYCKVAMGLYDYQVVMKGRCSQKEFYKGCSGVPENQGQQFRFWEKQRHLCVQRLHNYNFYSGFENIVNGSGYGRKNCSDGEDWQIDLIEPISCPVTDIINGTGYNESITGLGFSFARKGEYPVVAFRVSQHGFCEGLSEDGISPGRKANYILEKNDRFECNTTDTRTILISTKDQVSFIESNPSTYRFIAGIQQIISTLPAYPQLSSEFSYHLGFIRYPAWKYSCRKSNTFNLNTVQSYLTLSSSDSSSQLFLLLVILACSTSLLLLIYSWTNDYFYLKTKHMHGYLFLKDFQVKKVNPHSNITRNRQNEIFKAFCYELCPLAAVVLLAMLYLRLSDAKSWMESARACTDSSFGGYLKEYSRYLGGQMVGLMTSIFINIGILCLDACFLLWRCFKGDLESQHAEEQAISEGQTMQNSSKNPDLHKQLHHTQEFLIDNTFNKEHGTIEIYDLDGEEIQIISESEYSQSAKSD